MMKKDKDTNKLRTLVELGRLLGVRQNNLRFLTRFGLKLVNRM